MEKIAEKINPTEEEKELFIVDYNHRQGYEIRYSEKEETIINPDTGEEETITVPVIEAWGKTEDEKTEARKSFFEDSFITLDTNKNYRLQPKGYSNAQQSIDVINNMVTLSGSLTEQIATMILFYETPDFTDETQCTEEWLIQHQYSAEPMTLEEWQAFYVNFTTLYAQKMYQQALKEQANENTTD